MSSVPSFLKKIVASNPELDSDRLEYERYASLISILKGFEEYTLNKDGIIISSNLEAVTITGFEEWEVLGKHISIFYSMEDQLAGKPHDDLVKAEKRVNYLLTGLRVKKRNSKFWAKVKFRAIIENNRIAGFKMTMHDATHKAVNHHRIKNLKDEYLSLFNNSFVGIFKFSMTDFSVLMMNDKAAQIFSIGNNEKDRPAFNDTFKSHDDFLHLINHLRVHKRLEQWDVKIKNTNKWATISCRFFETKNFVEGIIVDNSALKESNNEVVRLKNELDQFIYHASHELRAPLVSMLGLINLVNSEKKIESVIKINSMLKEKVNQLDCLLRNITSIAYNNNVDGQNEEINWSALVESVLKELKTTFGSKVKVVCSVDQGVVFLSDVTRIRTMLRNLIANGLKYHNPYTSNPWVEIAVKVNDHNAIVYVRDNGIGIDSAYIKDIFRMFFKATEYPKGPGLGLYVAKAMTDKLGGTVKVDSMIGEGTEFQVVIPNRQGIDDRI